MINYDFVNSNLMANILSVIAIIISIYVYKKNLPKVNVSINESFDVLPGDAIYSINSDREIYQYHNAIHTNIEFINYGNKPISFFNMVAFNINTGEEAHLVTEKTIFSSKGGNKNMFAIIQNAPHRLRIPVTDSGLINSMQYQVFDIVIDNIPEGTENLELSVQIVSKNPWYKRLFFKNKNNVPYFNAKYKMFSKKYNVSTYLETAKLKQVQMKPVIEQVLKDSSVFETSLDNTNRKSRY